MLSFGRTRKKDRTEFAFCSYCLDTSGTTPYQKFLPSSRPPVPKAPRLLSTFFSVLVAIPICAPPEYCFQSLSAS
ncbi:hypothetical protein BOTBODRAFT_598782 [Botryobasidium botryosum FD-172 SS1]|uniref:Uncharacterized protein n=1 Tax=Botryobasidium botryosum (strain FD-172 SS1) TaxID=930990 RepID=A0A067N035_BOTB1|nr:hypothetical protein BOTBODRAFT_598782 [Botryobasidium botryosum FD-172 SS1]